MSRPSLPLVLLLLAAASCRAVESAPPAPIGPMVAGTVDYRERELLPTPAELEVVLVMVYPSGDDEEVLGTWSRVNPGSVPIAFEVPYELEDVDPDATYLVRARITGDAGRLWQTTRLFKVELADEANRVHTLRATDTTPIDATVDVGGAAEHEALDDERLDIGRVVLTRVPNRDAARARDLPSRPAGGSAPDVGPLVGPLAGGPGSVSTRAVSGAERSSVELSDNALEAARAAGAAEALSLGAQGAGEAPNVVVTGRLFRQPDVLPKGCLLSVRLIEAPRDGAPEVVVADKLIEDPAAGPLVFEFLVDLDQVDLARQHTIRADLVDAEGETLFKTTSLFSVPLTKAGETVDVGRILLVKVPR